MPSDGRSDYHQRFERALEGLRAGPGHESSESVEAGRRAGQDQGIEMDDFVQDTAEMERDLRRRSRLLPVGIALILLSAFGAVIWFAYAAPGGSSDGQQTVELIQADPEPVKTKPEDPGGMQVQHQDKLILNPDPEKPQIERLLPPPEAPVPVEAPVETAESDANAANSSSTPGAAPVVVTEERAPGSVLEEGGKAAEEAAEAVGNAAAAAGNNIADAGKQVAEGAESAASQIAEQAESAFKSVAKQAPNAASGTKPAAPAAPKEAAVTPKPVAKPTPVAKSKPATQVAQVPKDSGYVLQLASLRSEKDALTEWGRIQRQNSNLLAQMKPIVEKADIEGVGTRYRLQTGPFPTKATAQDLCAQLKASKQDCLVKRR